VLRDLGDYEEAKRGFLKVLEIKKHIYGEDHITYAITLNNLSISLRYLKDYEGAKLGFLKALNIYKVNYGEDHF
jgi:tetratricopeptide (TPR) repeat protein